MQKKYIKNGWHWFIGILALIAIALSAKAAGPYQYAVQVSASVSTSPAHITLSWVPNNEVSSYTISRKAITSSTWTQVATLAAGSTTWTDSNVAVGATYEYQLIGPANGYTATGYIYSGINADMIESRGKVLLVVDNTYATQLATELTRLQQDLAGDGWTVVRHDVNRSDSVVSVKNVIKVEYNNGGLRSVLLFGHVPVPYSGDIDPDGHPDHVGAYPADVYYADMDGNWTDNSVNDTGAAKSWNWNVPGDGKFDQSTIPSDVELEVGRVDLSNMTCFSNKTPSRSELDLLRQYLNKDHNFRHALLNVSKQGMVCDNWGVPYGEAFATAGWRLSTAFFGPQNAVNVPGNTFISTLTSQSATFCWAGGGGSFTTCAGVAGSDDFALNDIKAVFTLFLGSYFADWDNESAFLRAPLGGSTTTLTTGWSGRPEWWLHHMGLGETIGFGAKLTQNNQSTYSPQYMGTRGVHIALHGDPTLRLSPVIPPSNLTGVTAGSIVTLNWLPSNDSSIQGYYVYRSASANGPFTRVTSSLLVAPTYTDTAAPAGAIYMVRAVKLETTASGAYYNPSQGLFYTSGSTGGGGTTSAPVAPSNLTATSVSSSQIRLNWADNSSNETGFKIERKLGASGTYATVTTSPANAITFTDSGLASGTVYYYRLSSVNASGASTTIEANASTLTGAAVTASAAFVQTDATTSGTWKGIYGADGATVIGDGATSPGYVQITPTGKSDWTWISSTADPRALQRISASDRLASTWYSDTSFTVDLNFTDGQTHRTTLYFVDWDLTSGRNQTVEILDASSGAVLSSKTISNFGNGVYLVWDLKGAVRVRMTKISGFNAVLNGLFFGPASANSGGLLQTGTALRTTSAAGIHITGMPGQSFKVYSTSDLATWNLVTTITLTGSTYDFTEAVATGGKFYKAVPQ